MAGNTQGEPERMHALDAVRAPWRPALQTQACASTPAAIPMEAPQ